MTDPVTLVDAARAHHVSVQRLRELAGDGTIRVRERRPHGRGESLIFSRAELAEDLRRLPGCLAEGCGAPGTGAHGYCGAHGNVAGRQAARRRDREVLTRAAGRTWLHMGEAAAKAEVSRSVIATACLRGELQSTLVGRHRRIEGADLAAWQEHRATAGRRPPARRTEQARVERRQHVEKLHRQMSLRDLAETLGVSIPTIYSDLDALGLSRPRRQTPRHLSPRRRTERVEAAVHLYAEGCTAVEIAKQLGSSTTQIYRDLKAAGVQMRPATPRPKYEPAPERVCGHCGRPFRARSAAEEGLRGPRRYCKDECARAARGQLHDAALAERGLLPIRVAREQLGLASDRAVLSYIDRGWLVVERVPFEGMLKPALGVQPKELARCARKVARGGDGRRALHQNADRALETPQVKARIAALIREGRTEQEARAVERDRIERRGKAMRARRSGRKAHTSFNLRLAERLRQRHKEYLQLFESGPGRELGEDPPTEYQAAREVYEEDWREHPDDWPRDKWPADSSDPTRPERRSRKEGISRVRRSAKNRAQTA